LSLFCIAIIIFTNLITFFSSLSLPIFESSASEPTLTHSLRLPPSFGIFCARRKEEKKEKNNNRQQEFSIIGRP
jgi:hypothetical protein